MENEIKNNNKLKLKIYRLLMLISILSLFGILYFIVAVLWQSAIF